jgi:hypothetical protein
MMEEDLIIEVWDIFKEYIADKNKETAANHFVDFLVGKDVDASVLSAVTGFDPHLDDAIKLVLADEADEDDDFDEDDYSYDEDED